MRCIYSYFCWSPKPPLPIQPPQTKPKNTTKHQLSAQHPRTFLLPFRSRQTEYANIVYIIRRTQPIPSTPLASTLYKNVCMMVKYITYYINIQNTHTTKYSKYI